MARRMILIALNIFLLLSLVVPGLPAKEAASASGGPVGPLLPRSPGAPAAPQDVYTISGRVTDSKGNILAGIPVQAVAVTTPILFVPGFRGFPPKLSGCTEQERTQLTDDRTGRDYFGQVAQLLSGYYYVDFASLLSNACYTAPLEVNAGYLRESINRVKAATGAAQVILIAHGMGGLVSRAYLEGNDYQGDVEALYTLGSPHLGVPEDPLVFLANGIPSGELCAQSQPAACEFSSLGMQVFNQDHPSRRAGVKYYTISGDAPGFTRGALGLATGALIAGADDGMVATASGLGLPGANQAYPTDENHDVFGNLLYDWTYFGARKSILVSEESRSYRECLKPMLVDKTGDRCQVALRTQAAGPSGELPEFKHRTAIETISLLGGQVVTRSLALGGGATLFAARWTSGTVSMTLQSPGGLTIDAAYTAAHPEVVSHTLDAAAAAYYFPQAESGAWKLVFQGGGDIPAGGSAVSSFAAFNSAPGLSAGVDQTWYIPGATAVISAALQGAAVSSTLVTATLSYADGTLGVLPLALQGGQYRTNLAVPDKPGYVQVDILAAGETSGGAFERGASLGFQVAPGSIALSGGYADAPLLRTPGGYFYSALVVTASVSANFSGTYGLTGDLVDGQGKLVAHSLAIQDVITGSGAIPLRFSGDEIYASGADGPYTLTNLVLTDRRGVTLVVDKQHNAYQTAAYEYRRFGVMVSAFSAVPLQGPAPLPVQFSNESQGEFSASRWDFGDGLTSTLDSPV